MSHQTLPSKKTKIVCTIGPASQSQAVLEQLIVSGMDIARVNFSHGDLDSHRQVIANVRAAAAATGHRVAIMGDLPGPKMRIGLLEEEPIQLERDRLIILQPGSFTGNAARVAMSFAELPRVVRPGNMIYVNDGFIQLEVVRVQGDEVHCRVRAGGELRSRKGVNFPGIDLGISAFTDQDREFLAFAAAQELDAVSQSFVQDGDDIFAVRRAAAELGYAPFLIAKIERARALDRLDDILAAADGLMVARGDLGVEVPFEEIAILQKTLISKANLQGKPVITATHMLESMISNRRPTRAEVSDVSNAILDGTDCVMLSGETSIGSFPVDAVAAMAAIATYTEAHRSTHPADSLVKADTAAQQAGSGKNISISLYLAFQALHPDMVFVPSRTGATARLLARFHLPVWIVALCQTEKACQELMFSYGVASVYEPKPREVWGHYVTTWLAHQDIPAQLVLLTEMSSVLRERDTTHIEIIDLREGEDAVGDQFA
jgi:pyruvate kinase